MILCLMQLSVRRLLASLMMLGLVLSGIGATSAAHASSMHFAVEQAANGGAMSFGKMQVAGHQHQLPAKSLQHDLLGACSAGGCALCGVLEATVAPSPGAPSCHPTEVAGPLASFAAPPPTQPPILQL